MYAISRFLHLIWCELKKIITSAGFIISVICVAAFCFAATAYQDAGTNVSVSVAEVLFHMSRQEIIQYEELTWVSMIKAGFTGNIVLFLPIIVSLPAVWMKCVERRNKNSRLRVVRCPYRTYCFAEYFSGVLSAGLAAFCGYFIFGIIVRIFSPSLAAFGQEAVLNYSGAAGASVLVKSFLCVFFCGVVTAIPAIFLNTVIQNEYIVSTFSFVFFYLLSLIFDRLIQYIVLNGIQNVLLEQLVMLDAEAIPQLYLAGRYQSAAYVFHGAMIVLFAFLVYFIRRKKYDLGE